MVAGEQAPAALCDFRGEFRWLEDRWMPDAVRHRFRQLLRGSVSLAGEGGGGGGGGGITVGPTCQNDRESSGAIQY